MWKYCGNIFKLWFLILCLSFIHTFPFSFLFFSCILSTTHVHHCPLVHPLLFLFLHFHFPEAPSFFLLLLFLYFHLIPEALRLSHFLLSCFFFLFLHDSINSLALSVILDSIILLAFFGVIIFKVQTHIDTHGERRNLICSTTPPPLLLLLTAECMQPGSYRLFFFFLDHLLLL